MKEAYSAYQNRVRQLAENRACFPPLRETLRTAPGLLNKYDERGRARPFFGDTVVYPLTRAAISRLAELQSALYACDDGVLAERLPPETFHITLHDLSAASTTEAVRAETEAHEKTLPPLMRTARQGGTVRLRTVGIVSMVSSSLVMLFEPSGAADHDVIQNIYEAFDAECPLSYPRTLHCTLAYYRPGAYSPNRWNVLLEKVSELNTREPFGVDFDCSRLEYQRFASMRDYSRVEI